MHYVTVLIPEAEGGYSVLFPDFPGCATQGESQAEAIAAATEALSGHIAAMRESGATVPAPRELEAVRADRAWAADNEVDWTRTITALTPVRPPLGHPERVMVSLDSNFLRSIDSYAESRGLTRSAALTAGGEMLIASDPVPVRNKRPEKRSA
jgi:predicted RNase H-like HicB family nuclease